MKKHVLVIALVALVLMVAYPVSAAYTEFMNVTTSTEGSPIGVDAYIQVGTLFDTNITAVHIVPNYMSSSEPDGSGAGIIKQCSNERVNCTWDVGTFQIEWAGLSTNGSYTTNGMIDLGFTWNGNYNPALGQGSFLLDGIQSQFVDYALSPIASKYTGTDVPIWFGSYGHVAGHYYFYVGSPDVTPTPTPTPTGTIPTPYPTTPVPTVAPGYTRTSFQCTNSMNTAAISGCDIQLRNLEGNVWSNKSNTDGTWYIDTLPYAHINAYGQATGYSNGVRLNLQTWPTPTFYTILMVPGYVPPATTGNIWVYVHVLDADGGGNLADARVDIQGSGLTTRSDYTDSSGVVRFQWPNASTAYINAAKAGYTTSSRVITTTPLGPDIVDIELHRGVQTATIVPTTGPGGTIPTTIDPSGNPGDPGYSNVKGQEMMDYLASHGMELVSLCLLVTFIGLLKMAAKK